MSRMIHRSLALAILAALVVTAPTSATTGWLDDTFSGDGVVRLNPPAGSEPFTPGPQVIRDAPTGRIFLGRYRVEGGGRFEFLALTPAGAVDGAFNGGQWKQHFGGKDGFDPLGMFPGADGGLLGAIWLPVGFDIAVARFGPGGGVTDTFTGSTGSDQSSSTMVLLPGGSPRSCVFVAPGFPARLIGLTPSLDLDGTVWRKELEISGCHHIAADAASHLYVFDERRVDPLNVSRQLIEALRTSSSGRTDDAWANSGHAIIERGGLNVGFPMKAVGSAPGFGTGNPAVFPQPDGSLLIAARVSRFDPSGPWNAAVLKVTPAGELDPTFGNGGIKTMSPPDGQSRVLAMTVDGAGRPIVSLVYNHDDGRTRAYLARLTSAGTFDTTFGRNGLVQVTNGVRSIDIDAAGRILTMAWDGQSVIVARRTN